MVVLAWTGVALGQVGLVAVGGAGVAVSGTGRAGRSDDTSNALLLGGGSFRVQAVSSRTTTRMMGNGFV